MKLRGVLAAVLILGCFSCAPAASSVSMSADSETDGLWAYDTISDETYEAEAASGRHYTISFWIRPENNYPDTCIFSLSNNKEQIMLTGSGYSNEIFSGLTLSDSDGNWIVADGGTTVSTERWNYLALVVNGKTASLYLNGEEAASGTFHGTMSGAVLSIGNHDQGLEPMQGKLSDLRIRNESVSAETIRQEYESSYASVLLDTISIPDASHLNRDLWFVDTVIEGYQVRWDVEENDVLDARGFRKNTVTGGDAVVHVSLGDETSQAEKTILIHVDGTDPETLLEHDAASLDADIEGVLFSGTVLPGQEQNGSDISYSVISGGAEFSDTSLIKTSEQEKEPVVFEAVLTLDDLSVTRTYSVTLLDEAYGYVMGYFNGDLGSEKGFLALSRDGLSWNKVSGVTIDADLGSGRVRDPDLTRIKDGSFVLTATEGADNPSIYLSFSDDLITFTDPELILVSVPDDGIGMDGLRAWAPEVIYDNEADLYYVYFSDPHDDIGKIYRVTSTDLESFSYPKVMLDTGYPVIDMTIFPMNGLYWMIYKDERAGALTVYPGYTSSLEEGFQKVLDWKYLIPERPVEGPTVFQDLETGEYHIFVDNYSDHTFLAGRFTDLSYDSEIDWSDTKALSLPEEDVRHGSVIPITEQEYHALEGVS